MTAAADNLASTSQGYSALSTSGVAAIAGASSMRTPFGSSITLGTGGGSAYPVTVPGLPAAVCLQLVYKLKANTKFTNPSCNGSSVTYTYNSSS